jgi:hypothetical protein
MCTSQNQAILLPGIPSGLEHLKVGVRYTARTQIPFDLIPPFLTSLDTNPPVDALDAIKKLPRTLKRLTFKLLHGKPIRMTREMAECLPPRLECLSGLSFLEEALECIPSTLTHLDPILKVYKQQTLEYLPSGLDSLIVDRRQQQNDPISLSLLPKSITCLELSEYPTEPLGNLLPKLTKLDFKNLAPPSTIQVLSLPSTLKMLLFIFQAYESEDPVAEMPAEGLNSLQTLKPSLSPLPRSLTSLTSLTVCIPSIHKDIVNDDWISEMEDFSELKELKIHSDKPQFTSNVLTRLPRNLTSLKISIDGVIRQDHLIQVPKSLFLLSLSSNAFCDITDDLVSQLPRKIIGLDLPSCPYLTSNAAADLPPALSHFVIDWKIVGWLPRATGDIQ